MYGLFLFLAALILAGLILEVGLVSLPVRYPPCHATPSPFPTHIMCALPRASHGLCSLSSDALDLTLTNNGTETLTIEIKSRWCADTNNVIGLHKEL